MPDAVASFEIPQHSTAGGTVRIADLDGETDQLVATGRNPREIHAFEKRNTVIQEGPMHRNLLVRMGHRKVIQAHEVELFAHERTRRFD